MYINTIFFQSIATAIYTIISQILQCTTKEEAIHRLRLFINDKSICHFTGGEKLTSCNAFISAIFSVLKQWHSKTKENTETFTSPNEEFYDTVTCLFTSFQEFKLCHRSLIGNTNWRKQCPNFKSITDKEGAPDGHTNNDQFIQFHSTSTKCIVPARKPSQIFQGYKKES